MSPDRNMEPTPLPRGRHTLSRDDVLASQRERLIRAVFDAVSRRGYPATKVSDVVSTARVSRNAFYELFADKEDCFLAACDEAGEDMLAQLGAYGAEDDWVDAVRGGLHAYLAWWIERPWYAQAYLVELPAAGRRAVEQRDAIYARFTEMFVLLGQRARAEQPELPPLPALAPRMIVVAVTELLAQEARAGRVERLLDLEADLLHFVVRTLADDRTAAEAGARPPKRRPRAA